MLSEQSFKLIRRDRRLVLVEVESQRSFRTFIPLSDLWKIFNQNLCNSESYRKICYE